MNMAFFMDTNEEHTLWSIILKFKLRYPTTEL